MGWIDESEIISFYRKREGRVKRPLTMDLRDVTLTNLPLGLGDTLVLTDLPRAAAQNGCSISVHSNSPHFSTLMHFNPFYKCDIRTFLVSACSLCQEYDLGNGHFLQRLRRAYGFRPDIRPRPCLEVIDRHKISGGVVLHLEPGPWVHWQRKHLHPRAREIYPATLAALQSFILERDDLVFAEIGSAPTGLKSVLNWTGQPLDAVINRMATCEYFVGITSGPLHIAAALNLKLINIVNFPVASELCLPVLKDVDIADAEWLYPQSIVLHQEGEGRFVQRISIDNLQKAFSAELYPYFSDRYLALVTS